MKFADGFQSLMNAFALFRDCLHDDRMMRYSFDFALQTIGSGQVRLVDHEHVGDIHDTCFHCLHIVAHARHEYDDGDIGEPGDVHLVLADTDGFDENHVETGRVHEQG